MTDQIMGEPAGMAGSPDPTTPTRPDVEALQTLRDALMRHLPNDTGAMFGGRLDALIAAVRADATRAAEARIAGLERDLATFTAEPGILHRIGTEQTTYWYRQTLLADGKASAAEAEVAGLRAALEFLWRRLNRMSDGPAMYLIEHVLFCGCGNDQHLWDRSGARATLAALAARPAAPPAEPVMSRSVQRRHAIQRGEDAERCAFDMDQGVLSDPCGLRRDHSVHNPPPEHFGQHPFRAPR